MLIATFVPSVPVEATRPQQPPLASMTRRKAAQQWTPGGVPVNNTRATFKPPNNNPTASKKQPRFYAVRVGRNGFQGILQSWDACRPYVSGFSGATFKSFKTAQEARQYIQITPVTNQTNATPQKPPHTPKPKGIPPQPVSRPQPGLLGIDSPDFNDSRASLNELLASTRPEELAANAPIPSDEALPEMSVYTDGACSNNGKPNARAGYGVYFGKESPYNVSKPLKDNPTNQRAEMTAVLEAMRLTLDHGLVATGGTLSIYTDSKYTQDGLNVWIQGWKRKNWLTAGGGAVKNKEIWLALDACRIALAIKQINVMLIWVKGHSGVEGNEAADRLAVQGMHR